MCRFLKLLIIVFLFCSSVVVYGQRTMPGQFFFGVNCSYTFTEGMSYGAELQVGQYMKKSYWDLAVVASNRTCATSLGQRMDLSHLYVRGGAKYRLFSTSGRSFCFYAGGGAFVGMEFYDMFLRLPSNYVTGLSEYAFLYGLYAGLDMEMYIARKIALVLSGSMPVNFSSPGAKFNFEAGVGVRFLF